MNNWRQVFSWEIKDTAQMIAFDTQNAYSFDRYGFDSWVKCAQMFLDWGMSPEEVEEMLRSKDMRYIGDAAEELGFRVNGKIRKNDFERCLKPIFERDKQGSIERIKRYCQDNAGYNSRSHLKNV